MRISIPDFSLVVLIGASGSGKSTFARSHFRPTEVISSDFCRGLVADDENDQAATPTAFEVLHFILARRLAGRRLCVVDATNVQPEARKPLVALARTYHCLPVAIVLNLPEGLCQERNRARPERQFGPHVVRGHVQLLRRSLRGLEREGFRHVHVLSSLEEVTGTSIERVPLWTDRRGETGPFDIIGDVHGCYDELVALLRELGYEVSPPGDEHAPVVTPPPGRKAVFLGDLVDRGPDTPGVLQLAMGMVAAGTALCVPGNHDVRLFRKLRGRTVQITHGLAESLAQIELEPPEFQAEVTRFLDGLVSHYVLDGGRLVVAHAGLKAELQGRASAKVREFALYGETTGETDEFGLPIRYPWAAEYRGAAAVVYGHTPVPEPEWLNSTLNIDTGCVFGGRLTALRYPERELVSVPAAHTYAESIRPFAPAESAAAERTAGSGPSAQQRHDELLDIADVLGKRIIATRLRQTVTIREENAIAALEVMSRFAADPRWLIYLPPTMSPCETSREPGLLEHPAEAFAYYRHQGVPRVICEEKHMGSRAVLVLCRDEAAARRRFGVADGTLGACLTRTGRSFFDEPATEAALLARTGAAMQGAGLWDLLETDWVCLDCELMPWSAKAQALLRQQYAPVGAAARASLAATVAALEDAARREGLAGGQSTTHDPRPTTDGDGATADDAGEIPAPSPAELLTLHQARRERAERYVTAYRRYCWPVRGLEDLKVAPFHLLATESGAHVNRDHLWHMETLTALCRADAESGQSPLLLATPYRVIDLSDPESVTAGTNWWEELTGAGGEGMVVKPIDFITRGTRGLVQPAVKCRGREYLRIIYGPEYDAPENLERLRSRFLAPKRALALREFALGVEALERFHRREPLRRVHECVFGVLAMESEPVDPRL